MTLTRMVVALGLGASLVLSGCTSKGATPAPSASAAPVVGPKAVGVRIPLTADIGGDACKLFTAEQVSAATAGQAAAGYFTTSSASTPTCVWRVQGSNLVGPNVSFFALIDFRLADLADFNAKQGELLVDGTPHITQLGGLGESAWFADSGAIAAYVGKVGVQLQGRFLPGVTVDAKREALIGLATLATEEIAGFRIDTTHLPSLNVCDVLSTDEIGVVTGGTVGPPQAPKAQSCTWKVTGAPLASEGTVTASVDASVRTLPEFVHAAQQRPRHTVSLVTVEEAHYAAYSYASPPVTYFFRDGRAITISVSFPGAADDTIRGLVEQLAPLAAGHV